MTTPTNTVELVPADLDERAAEVERQVAQARAGAEAMQVTNPEEAERAARVLREIKQRAKAAEAERVALVKPLNDHVKDINRKFKAAAAPFDEVEKIVRGKLGTYQAEVERREREERERIERERQERERIAREAREKQEAEERAKREQAEREAREAAEEAAKAEADADREAAEQLAEEARIKAEEAKLAESAIAALPEPSMPAPVIKSAPKPQGISTRRVWQATVIDPAAVPRQYLVVDEKAIRQAVRDGVREIPGVKIEQVDQLAVRG